MRGIGLFSGGLDSQLAAKLIMVQKVDVLLVHFTHVFLTQRVDDVKHYAENLGAPLEVIDVSEDMVEIVKQPNHGYGDTMNPCIDCRIMCRIWVIGRCPTTSPVNIKSSSSSINCLALTNVIMRQKR